MKKIINFVVNLTNINYDFNIIIVFINFINNNIYYHNPLKIIKFF